MPALKPISHDSSRRESVTIRAVRSDDAESCGRIIYLAFRRFHESRGFAPDFPTAEAATDLARSMIADGYTFGVVAECGGTVVGSNFVGEGDPIRGIGPITVHPDHQSVGIGRALMEAVIARGRQAAGMRLVQDAFNTTSMALYARLGFEAREPLALLAGHTRREVPPSLEVRAMREEDLGAADALCRRVHAHPRRAELRAAHSGGAARVVLRGGRLTGYMTAPHLWLLNHAVAETDEDLKALIAWRSGCDAPPVSFLFPIRRAALFRWCLEAGLRVKKPMTLMTRGSYAEPEGEYLPSVLY